MGDSHNEDQCKIDVGITEKYREEIPAIVDQLILSCEREECFDQDRKSVV